MIEYDPETWDLVRARWEAGESSRSLGLVDEFPSRQAIDQRANKEGWQKQIAPDQVLAVATPEEWAQLDDRQKVAINAFALGCKTFKDAATRAGVSDTTLGRWREDVAFRRMCEAARLSKRDAYVANIEQHGIKDWRAHAYLLNNLGS